MLILPVMLILFTQDSRACLINWDNQDSTKVVKGDLKLANGFLLELLWRRTIDENNTSIINDYKYLLKERDEKLGIKDLQIKQQMQIAEDNLPSWYDHFWVGAVIMSIVFTGLILVVP